MSSSLSSGTAAGDTFSGEASRHGSHRRAEKPAAGVTNGKARRSHHPRILVAHEAGEFQGTHYEFVLAIHSRVEEAEQHA